MIITKMLIGVAIFLAALNLLAFGPEHGTEPLVVAGLALDSRTATALSIIGMVFGVMLTLRSVAEWKFAQKG